MTQHSLATNHDQSSAEAVRSPTPKIELVGEDTIVITGNNPEDLVPHLNKMVEIVHAIRHFGQDGDRSGRRAIARKKAAGIPLENNDFRIFVSYTNSATVGADGSVKISFLINAAGEHRLLCANGASDGQSSVRAMDSEETKEYFARLVSMCLSDLSSYLEKAFSPLPDGNPFNQLSSC